MCRCIPGNAKHMPLAILNIWVGGRRLHRTCQVISMSYDSVELNADVIIPRIVAITILPRVQRNAHRRRYALETHSFTRSAEFSTNRLKNKNNSIRTRKIEATEIDIEIKIKRIIEVDLVAVPNA